MNQPFSPGTRVQVRNRFDGNWSPAPFEVAETIEAAPDAMRYRIRRLSDGFVLPTDFQPTDLRFDEP